MAKSTRPSLTEALTPEEYDTLVALTEKASRLIGDRAPDYLRATKGYGPKRASDIEHIEFKARERDGRDPDGRYDIVIFYPDPYEDRGLSSTYVPSALLWDVAGATGKTLDAIEAERAELARIAEEAEAERLRKRADFERREAARLAKKFGYVKGKS